MKKHSFGGLVLGFLRDEDGVGTVFSLILLISVIMFGGVSADIQNVLTARAQLQMNADAVAHAALVYRESETSDGAKTKALLISEANMPTSVYGEVIKSTDIAYGNWDSDKQKFTVSSTSTSGVRVIARRDTSRSNPIATFLLWIVGMQKWDLSVTSTFETYSPTCFNDGFVAQKEVDIQSNDNFFKGFCIHSNDHVEINQNNYFEAGTRVSMPDLTKLELPASGFEKNTGLKEALIEGSMNIRILPKIDSIITGVQTSGSTYYRSYITSSTPITLSGKNPTISEFVKGRIVQYTCNGNGSNDLSIPKGTIENVVIVTNCQVKFSQDVVLLESAVVTTNTGDKSIQGASGLILGKKDDCAKGGESQLVTKGGFYTAADMKANGSQILAAGDIVFSAQGDGLDGISMVAGGLISGTSNMNMAICGTKETSNFQANYFRLAR